MKYIKLFSESSDVKLYKEIDLTKYEDLSIESQLPISEGEYNRVINFFYNHVFNKVEDRRTIENSISLSKTKKSIGGHYIEVFRTRDEYFLLKIETTAHWVDVYYICDTINGLLQCLKDNYFKSMHYSGR